MPNPPTTSETLFEAYLVAHGYLPERGVDWRGRFGVDTDRDPDFLVSRAREQLAVCEVKEFTDTPMDRRLAVQRFGTAGSEEIYGSAADAVQGAARDQLRPFAGLGLPLVVVLANPHGRFVPLGARDLTMSLFGVEDRVLVPVGGDGPAHRVAAGRGALVDFDADGRPFNPHPYLSAVVTVHARAHADDFRDAELARLRPPEPPATREARVAHAVSAWEVLDAAARDGRVAPGDYEYVHVFDLSAHPDFDGAPVPANVFDGPRDRWHVLDPGGAGFVDRGRLPPPAA